MFTSRYTDRKGEWFEIWEDDRKCLISIAYHNLSADLNAGYDPLGDAIRWQKQTCNEFEKALMDGYELFKSMTDEQVDRWCFWDLKKRGAIC